MYLNQLVLMFLIANPRTLSIVVQTYKIPCSEFIFSNNYFLGNGPLDALWIYPVAEGLPGS